MAISAVAALAVLLLLAPGVRAAVVRVDEVWHDLLGPTRNGLTVSVATVLYWVGDTVATATIRVALGLVLLTQRRWYTFWAWAVAGLLSPLLVEITKDVAERARPTDIVLGASGTSFPSGHAAAAATTSVMVVLAFVPSRQRRWAWVAAAAWTLVMAWSRNLLAAHWLSDVVVGILLGTAVPLVVFAAAATLQQHRRPTNVEEEPWDAPSQSPG